METGMTLAVKQQEAVHMALQNPISILTGGPGTGKTQTINAVIQVIQLIHPNAQIHLCAPTGRAAKRMTELTDMTATTIHRAIHLTDVRFDQNVERLYGDFLIVDESSMIDAYLFSKLLEAVNVDMKILFVGDVDQLPSIGAGLILRDLIDSKKIPTTTLTEIFRQAKDSQIVTNAHKVIQGKIVGESDGLTFDEKLGDFYFVQKEDTERIKNLIIGFIKRLMESPHNFKLQDIQVLTPMKEGELGTNALNRIIQETFNPHIDKELEMELFRTSKSGVINERFDVFRVGDRVIHTINDYDLKVFNGEIGTIHKIYNDESGNLMMKVNYDDGMVTYDEALAKEELMLAYAMTVHKSQGCEFPVGIMPIHPSQQSMLERHLLYTAFTRAKGKVVLAGVNEALNKGILNNITYHRNSKIKDRLMLELS
jgi:exodeoxyribonuclease V alpha subunit